MPKRNNSTMDDPCPTSREKRDFTQNEKVTSRSTFCESFASEVLRPGETQVGLLELKCCETSCSVVTCADYLERALPGYTVVQTDHERTDLQLGAQSVLVVAVRAWTEASTKWARKLAQDGVHLLLLFAHGVKVTSALDKLVTLRKQTPTLKDDLRPDLALHRFLSLAAPPGTKGALEEATWRANLGLAKLQSGHSICVFCEWTGAHGECHTDCPLWCAQDDLLRPEVCRNFRIEAHRLLSFWSSPVKWAVSVRELAADGFHYVGPEDKVQCAFCKLQIEKWEPNDKVRAEHKRWNAHCSFLNNANANVGNIRLGHEHVKPFTDSRCFAPPPARPDSRRFVTLFNESATEESLDAIEAAVMIHSLNMHDIAARLASFREWPPGVVQKPRDLASSGFYYTGVGDCVCCFRCGVKVCDWEPDDLPDEEHQKWNAACPLFTSSEPSPEPVAPRGANRGQRGCARCGTPNVNSLNLPCRHVTVCIDCNSECRRCESCLGEVVGIIRIFI